MKKGLKITLIILSVLIGLIVLDTIQAIVFNNSPIIKITKTYSRVHKKDIGIFVETDIYSGVTKTTYFKWKKRNLPIKEESKTDNSEKFDFYITKYESHDEIKFNDYITYDDRNYYLADNIKDFYVIDGKTMILKAYITNFDHTLENHSLKRITDELTIQNILKDGGTTIYKSKDKDVTIVVCKTLDGNDDVYIGDYKIEFDDKLMCK